MTDQNNQVDAILGISRDVSERKGLEIKDEQARSA